MEIIKIINLTSRRLVPIAKNGKSQSTPKGYRWLSIMNSIQKITETWFNTKLTPFMIDRIPMYQGCGKKRESLCMRFLIDRIHRLRNNMGLRTYSVYLDQVMAFDLIDREILFFCFELFGFGEKSMIWLRSFFENACVYVAMPNGDIVMALELRGIPQGSPLSPNFYMIFHYVYMQIYKHLLPTNIKRMQLFSIPDQVIAFPRTPNQSLPTNLPITSIDTHSLAYMDDLSLHLHDNDHIRKDIKDVADTIVKVDSIMQTENHYGTALDENGKTSSKSKISVSIPKSERNRPPPDTSPIHLTPTLDKNGNTIYRYLPFVERGKPFRLLGCDEQEDGASENDIRRKFGTSTGKFKKYSTLMFGSKYFQRSMKWDYYEALIISAMTYGCELWPNTKSTAFLSLRKSFRFQIRIMCCTNLFKMKTEKESLKDLHFQTSWPTLQQIVDGKLWNFMGRIIRRGTTDVGYIALTSFLPLDKAFEAEKNGINNFGEFTSSDKNEHTFTYKQDNWLKRVIEMFRSVHTAVQNSNCEVYLHHTKDNDDDTEELIRTEITKVQLLQILENAIGINSLNKSKKNFKLCDCLKGASNSLTEIIAKHRDEPNYWPSMDTTPPKHMDFTNFKITHDLNRLPPNNEYYFQAQSGLLAFNVMWKRKEENIFVAALFTLNISRYNNNDSYHWNKIANSLPNKTMENVQFHIREYFSGNDRQVIYTGFAKDCYKRKQNTHKSLKHAWIHYLELHGHTRVGALRIVRNQTTTVTRPSYHTSSSTSSNSSSSSSSSTTSSTSSTSSSTSTSYNKSKKSPHCHDPTQWHDSNSNMTSSWRRLAQSKSLWKLLHRITFKGFNGIHES